eukprot:1138731-Pelagomonas_calceolata.AAC.1
MQPGIQDFAPGLDQDHSMWAHCTTYGAYRACTGHRVGPIPACIGLLDGFTPSSLQHTMCLQYSSLLM